jgi:hypothetical protein
MLRMSRLPKDGGMRLSLEAGMVVLGSAQAEALIALMEKVNPVVVTKHRTSCAMCNAIWHSSVEFVHRAGCTYAAFETSLKETR